jgi:hypothetical protein
MDGDLTAGSNRPQGATDRSQSSANLDSCLVKVNGKVLTPLHNVGFQTVQRWNRAHQSVIRNAGGEETSPTADPAASLIIKKKRGRRA